MKQEDKDLLLTDLCARLPYGVFCEGITIDLDFDTDKYYDNKVEGVLSDIHRYKGISYATIGLMNECEVETIKPYLFPMSSMTEEQKKEYYHIVNYISSDDTKTWMEGEFIYVDTTQFLRLINFYHRNHLDYRGLINGGLAIDATGLNIY